MLGGNIDLGSEEFYAGMSYEGTVLGLNYSTPRMVIDGFGHGRLLDGGTIRWLALGRSLLYTLAISLNDIDFHLRTFLTVCFNQLVICSCNSLPHHHLHLK